MIREVELGTKGIRSLKRDLEKINSKWECDSRRLNTGWVNMVRGAL